ncbi:MAG: histidinol-phosphate transaminase [Anaerolineales bacterium]
MVSPDRRIRSHVLSMEPYQPILPFEVLSEQLGRPTSEIIKLDANENPYGPPKQVRQALCDLEHIHIYPDPESRLLRQALSRHHQIPMENIMAGAGADELIDLIFRLLIDPGDTVLSCPPTFGMYSFDSFLNRANLVEVPRKPDFRLDLPNIFEQVENHQPKVMFLANPNNPDGSLLNQAELDAVLDLPLIFVLDEAYIEFADEKASLLRECPARENLIVLRTFSKWAGLAGLRVGYGFFPLSLIQHLWKIKQPYNVSVAAGQAALAALEASDELERVCNLIRGERERLMKSLESISYLKPHPSEANFILCRVTGGSAMKLKEGLAEAGILVRYFNKPGLSDHIRISIGRPEENDMLMTKLKGWQ